MRDEEHYRHINNGTALHSVSDGGLYRTTMGEVVSMGATDIRKSIDELMQACDNITECEECTMCPLYDDCLKDSSVEDLWNTVSERTIARFLCYADKVVNWMDDELTEEDKYINANYLKWKEEYYESKGK